MVFGIAAGGGVELDELVFVDLFVIAGFGGRWGVVDDGDADVSIAAFAEAVGYCELEDELGVGCDCGGVEGWGGAVGVIKLYRVSAAVDLLPEVVEAVVFGIAAGGGVELDACAFVDFLVGASLGAGRGVVEDGNDDGVGIDEVGRVGYCQVKAEVGVGGDVGRGESYACDCGIGDADDGLCALLPKIVDDVIFSITAGGGVELDGLAFVDFLVGAGLGAGRGVVEDGDGDAGGVGGLADVSNCELEGERGAVIDCGGEEGRGFGFGVGDVGFGPDGLLPEVIDDDAIGVAAGGGVELDAAAFVGSSFGAGLGYGRDVVEDGDDDAVAAGVAVVVGYCELEAELEIGGDCGSGEAGLRGGGVAEVYRVLANIYLLPPIRGDAAVAVGAGAGIELKAVVFVDSIVAAGLGYGRDVVDDGDGDAGAAGVTIVVGYCKLKTELDVGVDEGGGEAGLGAFRFDEAYRVAAAVDLPPGVRGDAAVAIGAGRAVELDGCALVRRLGGAGLGAGRDVVDDGDA